MESYKQLQKLVEKRIARALRAYEDPKFLDEGLEGIFTLLDAIMGKVRRGVRPADITAQMVQSNLGKGFHIATMFDYMLVTEEALRLSWDNEKFPQGQHIACWEHVIPWRYNLSRIEDYLLHAEHIEEKVILTMLVEGSVKCFVGGREDENLRRAGLNSAMPDGEFTSYVFSRYESVGIEPKILEYHDFRQGNMKTALNKLKKNTCATTFAQYVNELTT